MFETRNFRAGPQGLLLIHRNRSYFLCCSKKRKLLQESSKHSSSINSFACFLSSFDSFLVLGIMSRMSLTRYLNLPETPREQATRVRCLFFHSFDAGSGSLNARSSSSESTCYYSSYSSFSELLSDLLSGWVGCSDYLTPCSDFYESLSDSLLTSSSKTVFPFLSWLPFFLRFLKTEAIT